MLRFFKAPKEAPPEPSTFSEWYSRGGDFFEAIIQRIYTENVRRGDTAIDVGANAGIHTLPLAKLVGRGGSVIAYEAIPNLAASLTNATAHLPQVKVMNFAVSNSYGRSKFTHVTAADGYSGLRQRDMPPEAAGSVLEIEVEQTTLDIDDLPHRAENLSFIKMDIEGGELDAMKGASRTIAWRGPMIVFENGRQNAADLYGYSAQDFFGFFAQQGYNVYDLFGRRFWAPEWDAPGVPWYSIAVPAGSDAEAYVATLPERIATLP